MFNSESFVLVWTSPCILLGVALLASGDLLSVEYNLFWDFCGKDDDKGFGSSSKNRGYTVRHHGRLT